MSDGDLINADFGSLPTSAYSAEGDDPEPLRESRPWANSEDVDLPKSVKEAREPDPEPLLSGVVVPKTDGWNINLTIDEISALVSVMTGLTVLIQQRGD